jgi:lysophospholipase L1-like esterase
MVNQLRILVTLFFIFSLSISCSVENIPAKPPIAESIPTGTQNLSLPTFTKKVNYLALGDSYTIGESVCSSCRFPEQLKQQLEKLNLKNSFSVDLIARTGWTTTDLKVAVQNKNPALDYDLVSLLIGVNNQFRGQSFSVYQREFKELVEIAILTASNDKKNLIVISIPDYAFTPFGTRSGKSATISKEIASYNEFAKKYCEENAITYINITDITQQGLQDPALVASDGLHPSEKAYALFVNRIIVKAVDALQN